MYLQLSIKTQQELTLYRLLDLAGATEFGAKHHFDEIKSFQSYAERVPIQFYEDLEGYIERAKKGEKDLLWPGDVNSFAVSAGTTGKGKHLPLTEARLLTDHLFMKKVASSYLKQRPNVFSLWGSHLSLPGSIERSGKIRIGEISGFSALRTPLWLNAFQLIEPEKLTRLSFREKFNILLEKSLDADLRVITAVPSWILTLFQEVMERTKVSSIAEIWPNLRLLVCGGVKLAHYRDLLEKMIGPISVDFIETYGASEGYFAYTDQLEKDDLRLVTDNHVYYEFIPDPLPDKDALSIQDTVPVWEVEPGRPYAVLVTTDSGLWRYALRDIIEFTHRDPPRIRVIGRVSDMIDDFGEGLYVYEAEKALEHATAEMGLEIGTFAIHPLPPDRQEEPRHLWLVHFTTLPHAETLKKMASSIDEELCNINRHYAIRRESCALGMPVVKNITQQDINRWLESQGKIAAQSKLPKILRKDVEALL